MSILEHFHHPKRNPAPTVSHAPFHLCPVASILIQFVSIDSPIPNFTYLYRTIWGFCGWIISVSIIFSRFIHVTACNSTSFLFFFLLNNFPFYGYAIFYLSIHYLRVIWIFSTVLHSAIQPAKHISPILKILILSNSINILLRIFTEYFGKYSAFTFFSHNPLRQKLSAAYSVSTLLFFFSNWTLINAPNQNISFPSLFCSYGSSMGSKLHGLPKKQVFNGWF